MAVQIPDPGTGNGQTGDNEYVFRKKVKDNFSVQTNAASRLIGRGTGQIPTAEEVLKAANSTIPYVYEKTVPAKDCNDIPVGDIVFLNDTTAYNNSPPLSFGSTYYTVSCIRAHHTTIIQIAYSYDTSVILSRTKIFSGAWQPWAALTQTKETYTATTAAGANVVVDTTGKLMRSTSSERYKDILAPLELDDARYADAMALKPIVYRSTADADNPAYHYYSFSAEELGAYDPAFTLWRETEAVTDADGNVSEQPLAERQAEGININALLAMSHAIAIKQDKLIKALLARIEILEAK